MILITANTTTTPTASKCPLPVWIHLEEVDSIPAGVLGESAGKKCARYSEKSSAEAAMGAANPAKNDIQPLRNPQAGPQASRR
jgi:hypothetical protein